MLRLTVILLGLWTTGPAGAGQTVQQTCSSSRTGGQTECIQFLKGFQSARGWRCHVFDWSEYLITHIPPDQWVAMGGLVPIVEQTSDAFCDKGFPDK